MASYPAYTAAPDVNWSTSDLCDLLERPEHAYRLQVLSPGLATYGGHRRYFGQVTTLVQTATTVPLLSAVLSQPGQGRILVAKALPDNRFALLGDRMAGLAVQNGWAGILVGGFIRDADELARLPLGVHALGVTPKRAGNMTSIPSGGHIELLGARIDDGAWIYADADGVIVLDCRHTQL